MHLYIPRPIISVTVTIVAIFVLAPTICGLIALLNEAYSDICAWWVTLFKKWLG